MTGKQLEEHLTVIAAKAKGLRDAGVVGRVTIGDVSFELAEVIVQQQPTGEQQEHTNPLDDPATYGGQMPQPRVLRPPQPPHSNHDDDEE